jgi:hypothetical protein
VQAKQKGRAMSPTFFAFFLRIRPAPRQGSRMRKNNSQT